MTTVKCINLCLDSSYDSIRYAGVEAGTQCFCGIEGDNYAALGQRDDADCNVPCAVESSQICGSDFAMAVYDCKYRCIIISIICIFFLGYVLVRLIGSAMLDATLGLTLNLFTYRITVMFGTPKLIVIK